MEGGEEGLRLLLGKGTSKDVQDHISLDSHKSS